MSLRDVLRHPAIYQGFQRTFGFFGARLRAMDLHLPLSGHERVLDIGCGPGFLVPHLPPGVRYVGVDTDATYIEHARRRFGRRAEFHCRPYDAEAARELGGFDVVLMNGLLHHLDDATAGALLALVAAELAPGGRLLTLDGCYRSGQPALARWLLDHDRGTHVRDEDGYRGLATAAFPGLEIHLHQDLSWFPYTFIVMVGRTADDASPAS